LREGVVGGPGGVLEGRGSKSWKMVIFGYFLAEIRWISDGGLRKGKGWMGRGG
jgi:hypothetical protein